MFLTKVRLTAAVLVVAATLTGLAGARFAAPKPEEKDGLTIAEYQQVRELVKPLRGEAPWNKVKWIATLWEAQAKAAKEGKPIAICTTGGEPLGIC